MHKAKEVAELLLRIGAVSINTKEPFVYTSGIRSPIYCDNRLIISYPKERKLITDGLLREAAEGIGLENIDVIAGTATAAIPYAAWLAERLDRPMVYVRSAEKGHGKGQQLEGRLRPGQRVVVVEDLVTTGGSSLATVSCIRGNGGVVDYCLSIFSYETKRAADSFEKEGVHLITLTAISTLLQVAQDKGYINRDDKNAVMTWLGTVMEGRAT